MSDAQYALSPSAAPPPSEADYDAIFAAVMETARGRWFLGEFAKRNRNADSELVLAALDRVEAVWRQRDHASPTERVKFDLLEMAKAIAQTKAEIAAITPEGEAKGTLLEATEELDSIVQTTEHATSTILAAAEHVQEIAWTLRERGTECEACDALDQRATDIYSACSFQDLTGQRTRKVVEVMRFLEERIEAMIDIWGATEAASPAAPVGHAPRIDDGGAEGHLDQPHIDEMMPGGAQPQTATAGNGHDVTGHDMAARPAAVSDTDTRDADVRDPDAHDAVAQDARVEEAGAREAVTQEAVTQEAVTQDAVAQDAVADAFAETGASDAHADDGVHEAPSSAVADRDSAAPGEIPPGAEREVSPAPAASAMAPEPTESVHEPEPEPLAVPALDELRNDPAALLSRILAIIHVPTEEASEESVSAPGAVGSPAEADASPEPAPEALSEIVAGSAGESAVMVAPPEDEAKPAPMDVGIEPEADILPAPRPISVAEAVEEMLQKATARSAVPTRPGEAALAMMADPAPTAERAPKAAEAEKPAHAPQSFVMDVPGFAPDPVQAPAPPPVRPAHSERRAPLPGAAAPEHAAMDPVPDHALPEVALAGFGPSRPESGPSLPEVALPAPEPGRPEPKAALPDIAHPDPIRPDQDAALPDIALRESEAPAPTLSQELPSVPAAPALPRFVAFPEMSPVAAPSSAKPVPVPAAPPVAAASTVRPMKSPAAPRTDVLAAIAALSEEEKIALFS
jgi:chemotaxis regulatin CheY-phosphate phosphatase CheZ